MGISEILSHVTQFGEGGGSTYMGKHASNKTMVKFPLDKNTDSKKSIINSKVVRADTSTKYVSQSRSSNESNILLSTFGTLERTRDESK